MVHSHKVMKLWRNYFMTYVSECHIFAGIFADLRQKKRRSNDIDLRLELNAESIENLTLDSLGKCKNFLA